MDFVKQEYQMKTNERNVYLEDLKNIIIQTSNYLEGNCFYHHMTLNEFPELYSKQLNLFWCGKQAITNICEIGFNAGHSSMLMLLGRDKTPINFTVFDIGYHPYTRPCFQYIKSKFSHVNFEYIEGDSAVTMPHWINKHPELLHKYDVVHVDGGHFEHCISNDMINSDLLVKIDGIVIVDDTDSSTINKYVDLYLSSGNYVEVDLLPTYGYPHRVIKKIK
jgi:3D (Asp-Asp-Asp) domain-containing protein